MWIDQKRGRFSLAVKMGFRKKERIMSKENKKIDRGLIRKILEVDCEDPLASTDQLTSQEIPRGVDRRNFLIRSAVGGAAAV